MGTVEESTPSKPSKPASSTQELPSTPYPDWSSSMQAYYGAGGTPAPFFPSPVASPYPYMWGAQHHMMSPYGTPVPYPALYPPGGGYAHPTMPMALNSAPANAESAKDQASAKKTKGNTRGKGEGSEKVASGSDNDDVSQSDDSATEGSSEGNNENLNKQEQGSSRKGSFEQMLADASSQNKTTGAVQGSLPMKPVAPATNLNMGMELWSSGAGGAAKMRPNTPGANVPAPEQWIDERELKRQKRKQSNRESARKSRLRKQAECEQLQQRVESLANENHGLREELQRLSEECEKLKTENNSIKASIEKTAMSGGGTKEGKANGLS
ncbi:PREDICTED: G-box-binding factor 1-like isoform X2 [Tarenaya hassleriana]|uniref:G-box-binding factor 1-like isoform X2 n=1 Tax=Tarenaya hassleriana TaxID=28532 RepID=UPI00053C56D4|nr:PREDICTED: G-box-binding factor 1-like isoform X2 [Tarenaya hassleriana]